MEFKKVAMIGMGAIGSVYGYYLYKLIGDNFMVVAGGERAQKFRTEGFTVNEETFFPKIVDVEDTTEKADLIIFAVKNNTLSKAIADTKNIIDDNTVILPILNGVSARDELLEAYPNNHIFYGLAIGIDAIRHGTTVVSEDMGRIRLGDRFNRENEFSPYVLAVKTLFENAGIRFEICEDMEKTIWHKWIVNIGINQIFSITLSPYGGYFECPHIKNLVDKAMAEVVEVGMAKGVNINYDDLKSAQELLKVFPKDSKTSMHQDVEAKRKTEVEYFSGKLVEYGKELGVPTPLNEIIYDMVKGMEYVYLKK